MRRIVCLQTCGHGAVARVVGRLGSFPPVSRAHVPGGCVRVWCNFGVYGRGGACGGRAAMCASVCLYVLPREGARECVCPRGVGVLVTQECARVSTCIDARCWRGWRCVRSRCASVCARVCTCVGLRRRNTFVFSSTHRACNPSPASFLFFPFAPSHLRPLATPKKVHGVLRAHKKRATPTPTPTPTL